MAIVRMAQPQTQAQIGQAQAGLHCLRKTVHQVDGGNARRKSLGAGLSPGVLPRAAITLPYASQALSCTFSPRAKLSVSFKGSDLCSGAGPKSYKVMLAGAGLGNNCDAEIGTAQPPKLAHLLSLGALYTVGPGTGGLGAPHRLPATLLTLAEWPQEEPPHWPPPVSSWAKPQPPCARQPFEPRQVW